jgi:hypothetical protein
MAEACRYQGAGRRMAVDYASGNSCFGYRGGCLSIIISKQSWMVPVVSSRASCF